MGGTQSQREKHRETREKIVKDTNFTDEAKLVKSDRLEISRRLDLANEDISRLQNKNNDLQRLAVVNLQKYERLVLFSVSTTFAFFVILGVLVSSPQMQPTS